MPNLRDVALWCIDQHRGILTAETRVQVKLPSYVIVECDDCGSVTLQKNRPKAGPLPCEVQQYSAVKGTDKGRPNTKYCKGKVEVVEVIEHDAQG